MLFEILQINQRAEKIKNCIRFDKGSANFPFPKEFLFFFKKASQIIKNKYFSYPSPQGDEELRELIAFFENKRNQRKNVKKDDVVITSGGMSGLFGVFSVLFKKGEEVLLNKYSFEGFSLLVKYFSLKEKRVDFSKIEECKISKKTKALVFNSPENPTGKVYSKNEVKKILNFCEKNNLYLISDEVMNQIVYDEKTFFGPPPKENVFIINSFSKAWFLPGLRLGWIIVKNKKFKEKLINFFALQSIGISLLSQIFMREILKKIDYEKFIKKYLKILERRRNIIQNFFLKEKISFLHKVEGGMVFYIETKKDADQVSKVLFQKYKTAVVPGKAFEGKKSTCIRVGFGSVKKEEIMKGLENIKKVIRP